MPGTVKLEIGDIGDTKQPPEAPHGLAEWGCERGHQYIMAVAGMKKKQDTAFGI